MVVEKGKILHCAVHFLLSTTFLIQMHLNRYIRFNKSTKHATR